MLLRPFVLWTVLAGASAFSCGSSAPAPDPDAPSGSELQAPELIAASDYVVETLEVRLKPPTDELEIRFTTDGSEPTEESMLYQEPLVLTEASTVRARSYRGSNPVGGLVEQRFERLVPHAALGAAEIGSLEVGLRVERFAGAWDTLPEFDGMTAEAVWIASAVGARAGAEGAEPVPHGLRITGYLQVPASALYRFDLGSDDGARLRVGGELVLGGGVPAGLAGVGSLPLAAGWHALEIEWLGGSGDREVSLHMGPDGGALRPPSPGRLAHR